MIIYQSTKAGFLRDHDNNDIADIINASFFKRTNRYVPQSEFKAWHNSLGEMAKVLRDDEIPDDVGVGVEYGIPQSSMRIDFILSGMSEDRDPLAVIVELKQWSNSKISDKDGIVIARRGGATAEREGPHPSYQAWSYAMLLKGFNEAVYEGNIGLKPCAYLHNYVDDQIISSPHYEPYTKLAPLFLKGDLQKLKQFVKAHVRHGDNGKLLYTIDEGRIRPSKLLADSVGKMLKGNQEFILVDDQKVAYETVLALAKSADTAKKRVVIIRGGPGTGKSVIAINLVAALTRLGMNAKYVSKNAAPRSVYRAKLAGQLRAVEIANLFSGSGAFIETPVDTFDALIVDEAHRLNARSGLYGNLGENQVKEIIASSRCAVFFVDDDQLVTLSDIGHSGEIRRWADHFEAEVCELELTAQFRCNGSDGYLAWLDELLGVHVSSRDRFDPSQFDFRVVDSPEELDVQIRELNTNNRARMVAGYCWDWRSKRDPRAIDIDLSDKFQKRWNLASDGSLWIVAPGSVEEVGCIHTCQGLEVDYIGVIIGPDLVFRSGKLCALVEHRSGMDRSVRGYIGAMQADPAGTSVRVEKIIRNTYRALMTHGMKGCLVYSTDEETRSFIKRKISEG